MRVDDRYRRGVEILQQLSGNRLEPVGNKVAEVAPDFARMTLEFPFGDLYARDALDLKSREVGAIAALAAIGAMPQLRVHVAAALHLGWTRAQVVEMLMQCAIYAGFPAALNALAECHDLLVEPEPANGVDHPDRVPAWLHVRSNGHDGS
jgi:4-carboxymuconolactone decarboxylase